jgi:hypothetical protein
MDSWQVEKQISYIFRHGLVHGRTAHQGDRLRKVLGASVPGIVRLLAKEFVLLVILVNLIALPLAYFAMNR